MHFRCLLEQPPQDQTEDDPCDRGAQQNCADLPAGEMVPPSAFTQIGTHPDLDPSLRRPAGIA
ncbi:MAG: hypothetical protein V1789_01100 [PVC group bacterium]